MKILVTGVAGFIGFHLSKRLLDEGHEVTGIDNMNDYYSVNLKKLRISILESKKFTFLKEDINKINLLNKKFDLIINLAAQAGVRVAKDKRSLYQYSNIDGFKAILAYCNNYGLNKIIYASSSSVYDDSRSNAFSEEETELKPKSLYGKSKLTNENDMEIFNGKIDSIGLRFFSVYGPFGRPDMAYFSFSDLIKKRRLIKLHNNGSMARDMTYITDAVDGIMKAMAFLMNTNENVNNELFNIGSGSPILTSKLLGVLEKKIGKKAIVKNINVSDESLYTHADLKKSNSVLGYNPIVTFEEGIQEFLEWHKTYEKH